MFRVELNQQQARTIANYIVKNQPDGEYDTPLGATSELISFRYRDGIGEVFSDFLAEDVVEHLPKGYRKMFREEGAVW